MAQLPVAVTAESRRGSAVSWNRSFGLSRICLSPSMVGYLPILREDRLGDVVDTRRDIVRKGVQDLADVGRLHGVPVGCTPACGSCCFGYLGCLLHKDVLEKNELSERQLFLIFIHEPKHGLVCLDCRLDFLACHRLLLPRPNTAAHNQGARFFVHLVHGLG